MIRWLFVPIGVFGLLVLLAWNNTFGLSLDKTIKLSDLPTLLASLLVAYVLQYLFTKSAKTKDIEKDLLAKRIESVLDALLTVRRAIGDMVGHIPSEGETRNVVAAFENCAEAFTHLEASVEHSHCKNLSATCWALSGTFLNYKSAITGGNFPYAKFSGEPVGLGTSFRHALSDGLLKLQLAIARL